MSLLKNLSGILNFKKINIFIGNKIDMRPTENADENKFVTYNIA